MTRRPTIVPARGPTPEEWSEWQRILSRAEPARLVPCDPRQRIAPADVAAAFLGGVAVGALVACWAMWGLS